MKTYLPPSRKQDMVGFVADTLTETHVSQQIEIIRFIGDGNYVWLGGYYISEPTRDTPVRHDGFYLVTREHPGDGRRKFTYREVLEILEGALRIHRL